jgi:hypothetical protein
VFSGNMSDWQKFANTLKLKMYLRYVNVGGSDANNPYKAKIVALLADNNFLTKDAKFIAYKSEVTGYNPFYGTFLDRLSGNVVANKTLIDFLTLNADPRKSKLFAPSVTGANLNGMATGEGKNFPTQTYKNYATPAITTVNPVYFFSKEEVLFLIAEAKARYGSAAAAESAYNSAIATSLTSLGVTDPFTTPTYNGVQSIIEQKWVAATNKNAIEAFFDYNRTGYPGFFTYSQTSVFGKDGSGKSIYPKRLFFPASERKTNANTPDKVALTVPVWWAK